MQLKLYIAVLLAAVVCAACGQQATDKPASANESASQKSSGDAGVDKAFGGISSNSVKRKSD